METDGTRRDRGGDGTRCDWRTVLVDGLNYGFSFYRKPLVRAKRVITDFLLSSANVFQRSRVVYTVFTTRGRPGAVFLAIEHARSPTNATYRLFVYFGFALFF